MAADDTTDFPGARGEEPKTIHDIVRAVARPRGFNDFEIRYDDDWAGQPATWISFTIPADYPIDQDHIAALTELVHSVTRAVLDTPTKRFPYVSFTQPTQGANP